MARKATPIDPSEISEFLQLVLRIRRLPRIGPVEAARWLDGAGILDDCLERPGKPLRELLRAGKILGRQEPNRRWYIDRKP